ncbi:DNRLRE domain-containing protein [Aeribacillus pallidus]|uniref:DNRLRE domain-containing protein n=1 Tax=Aeribacillus pallidus TaxID=33936 RepID=UPI003D222899
MPTQAFKVGEMLNKRTRNSKTWINFDGSYTTEIYAGDVHYQDEDGNWHNINTDLYDEADLDQVDFPVAKEGAEEFRIMKTASLNMKKKNILDRDMMDYQGLKVPFDCRIPKNFKRGYTVGKGENKLRFIPVAASPAKGYLEEGKKNCIHYQDAWNDTDVCLEVMPNGVKETIILKSDRAPFSFSFEVDGPLEDDLTAGNLKLQPAWLQDANGERRDVSQTIRRDGDKTYIDLVADVTGLTYPIEIDPTVVMQPEGAAGKDTMIVQSNSTSNYGTSPYLQAGYEGGEFWSLLEFDLSSIPGKVTSSTLSLYCWGGNGSSPLLHAVALTSSWDENTVTWSEKPSFTTSYASTSYTADPGKWLIMDVTSIVDAWVSGLLTNYGLAVKQSDSNTQTKRSSFYSSDYTDSSLRPKLAVTYNEPPTAPTVTSPNGGETWNAQHTITWNAATDAANIMDNTSDATSAISINDRWAQTFTIYGESVLKTAKFYAQRNSGQPQFDLYVDLYTAKEDGSPNVFIQNLASKTVIEFGKTLHEFTNLDVTLQPGTYCVVFRKVGGGTASTWIEDTSINKPSWKSWSSSDGVTWYLSNYDLGVYIETTSNLQYQIQLSTDNGQNWYDIVSLTSAGATSYTYDFINEPETSTAKIRIRAYDGASYGPWDESDGVFTIQHNQAPTVPTNLSPSGGTPKDRASVIRLSWEHNDSDGDPQAQFDLEWRLQGNSTWNTVTEVTTNQYWDAPGGTFPRGTIEWRVRTYDQEGLSSPYSDIQTFFAGDKPANPTITDPTNGATVPVANPTVQWSSVGQTAYHVKLLDINNNLLWEVQANSTNKAQTIQYSLANNTDYKIQVAIKNADNLWSDFITSNIHVSYTPPAVPVVTTAKGEGIITIMIDNPTPTVTQPNVSYNDVYRRKHGESTWTRIATNIPADASFVDYTPASGQVYEYFVRAWGDNGTYSNSSIVSESITLTGVWLHEADNPLNTLHQFKLVSDRSENWQPTAAMMQFAGRRLPVAEYDDNEKRSVIVKLTLLKDNGDKEALERMIYSKNTLCYRDARGRKMFCHVFQLPVDDELYGNTVSLTFEEVSYTEEV